MEHIEIIKLINSYFLQLQSQESKNIQYIEHYELLTQDLLHEIELSDCDDEKKLEIINKIRDARIKRRMAKDENYIISQVTRLIDRYPMCFNELGQIINSMNSKKKILENRKYNPRTIEEIECGTRTNFGELLANAINNKMGDK